VDVDVALGGSLGVGYSVKLLEIPLSGPAKTALRILLGVVKVLLDLSTLDGIGFVRDAMGLVGGVEELVGVELVDPIVDFVIPMPEEVPE
jgi:hypothetical protein